MRLAICHPYVIPARGGCETYIADLARCMVADGHRIDLYACRWDAAALPAEVVYHQLPEPGWPRFLRPWRFSTACRAALAKGTHDLSLSFDKVIGTDVLYPLGGLHIASANHSLNKSPSRLARLLGRGLRWFDLAHHSFSRLERRQYLGTGQPLLLANSDFVRRQFQEVYGIPPERVSVLHCAIDPGRFTTTDRLARRAEVRRRLGIDADTIVPLFVGMNYRLKGLDPLLRSLQTLSANDRVRLVVVGHSQTSGYERLAHSLGVTDRVCFAGFSADPRDYYFAADMLVHPTFYDPCSLVVLEARACGLPVITSRFNGAAELLDPPVDGLVVTDPHDHGALGTAIRTYLDPTRRQSAARAALQNGATWTWDHHYRRLLQLLTQAIGQKQAA